MAELTDDDLDRLAACLPDCVEIYGPYRPRHAPDCRHDDIGLLVAEVRRLRDGIREHDRRYTLDGGGPVRGGGGPMTRTLVVASPTTQPLCTTEPVPTGGQPEWGTCDYHGRTAPADVEEDDRGFHVHWPGDPDSYDAQGNERFCPVSLDGPFPFTVARWAEVRWPDEGAEGECIGCGRTTNGWFPSGTHGPGWYCGWCECIPDAYQPSGAIVELVEIVGPSHHADECYSEGGPRSTLVGTEWDDESWCHSDALPDCWHTPVSQITRLYPTPTGRPEVPLSARAPFVSPASWWWADLNLDLEDDA